MRRALVATLVLATALAACGRVGPPLRPRPEPRAAAAEPAPADAEEDADAEEEQP